MAEHESIESVTAASAASAPAASATAPAPAEKPWLLGQTPSMWFLIDSAVVLLIVIVMWALS